jgi:FdhD protein
VPDRDRPYRPLMSRAGRAPTHAVAAVDEHGRVHEVQVAGELPLTLVVEEREIVTLTTLGNHPEALALGLLRNQRLVEDLEEIVAVEVEWEHERVRIATRCGSA